MNHWRIDPKIFLVWLAICTLLGKVLSWLSGMPFWVSIAIIAVALLINGIVAEIEDSWPGGFLNPWRKSK